MSGEAMRLKVIEKSPVLGEILAKHGRMSLFDYALDSARSSETAKSSAPMLSVVGDLLEEIFDAKISQEAIAQLSSAYYVSSAEHHGPLTHSFFIGSNIVRSFVEAERGNKFIFVFACGGISMSNSSFPRGHVFHKNDGAEERLIFVPWRARQNPVYGYPAYSKDAFALMLAQVNKSKDSQTSKKVLENISIYGSQRMFEFKYYSDQVTHANHELWRRISGMEDIHLIYLQQEDIVNRLLIQFHFPNRTSICHLLTDPLYLDAFETYFDGIPGAFSGATKGTFLFWLIRGGKREPLFRKQDRIQNKDSSYVLKLTDSSIVEAIEDKQIMPSLALMFIVCAFYHGLTCFGGFSQVTYLAKMKEAYKLLLQKVSAPLSEIHRLSQVKTDILCEDMSFVFFRLGEHLVPATLLDLLIYGKDNLRERLLELMHSCTLTDALDQMMPELHRIYYGTSSIAPPFAYPPL